MFGIEIGVAGGFELRIAIAAGSGVGLDLL